MPPNIVLVVMDTARADAFEPWGAPTGSTPAMTQLASRGRGYPHVRSNANWTVPGHASLFSGEWPRSLGLGQVQAGTMSCAAQIATVRDRWLPEVLRRHGYDTSAVSANLWISVQSGFDAGFNRFEHVDSTRRRAMGDPGLRARLGWAREGARGQADDGARAAEACLERWIADGPGQPFFWFVNLTECHSPYLPPRPYNDLSLLRRIKAADDARSYLSLESIWRTSLGAKEIPDAALELMGHLYRASVRALDAWLARLLERLDAASLLDDTIVIVTSDHGENLGECGLIGHCFSLDDRLLRVPFVSSWADFPEIASLADLPRAVAERVGVENHPWGGTGGVVVAQMEALATPAQTDAVVDLWGLNAEAVTMLTTSATCAVEGTLKLVRRDDGYEEAFLLDADPLETAPLRGTTLGQLDLTQPLARLRRAITQADERIVAPIEPVSVASPHDAEAERIRKKMHDLGYL